MVWQPCVAQLRLAAPGIVGPFPARSGTGYADEIHSTTGFEGAQHSRAAGCRVDIAAEDVPRETPIRSPWFCSSARRPPMWRGFTKVGTPKIDPK